MSIGELGCPSLDYVYDMTWAEYMIRLYAYRRKDDRDTMMLRELTWITYIAPHLNPKKLKKSKNAFWPIKKKGSSSLSDEMAKRIREAQDQYHKEVKAKQDG